MVDQNLFSSLFYLRSELLMRKYFGFQQLIFFSVSALLIGGIIGVAGQFDYWECAAVSMYPLNFKHSVTMSSAN